MNAPLRTGLAAALLLATACADAAEPAKEAPLVVGLDHIPLAVRDLDAAGADFRKLGFVLKPGRYHPDGIRNLHAKFADGSEIELITAAAPRDELSRLYVEHLREGEGPAFLGLYAPELPALLARLAANGQPGEQDGDMVSLPQSLQLGYLFFGGRERSPTDRAEYFRHPNGADALIGVWLALPESTPERRLLPGLGVPIADEPVHAPEAGTAPVAHLPQGEVVFLPAARQQFPNRPIVGATVHTGSLDAVITALRAAQLPVPPVVETPHGRSLFLPPQQVHGLWLEFRETR